MLKLLRSGRVLESLGHEDEIDSLKGAAASFGAAVVNVWRSNGVEDEEPDPCLPPNVCVCDGDG